MWELAWELTSSLLDNSEHTASAQEDVQRVFIVTDFSIDMMRQIRIS